MTLENEVPSDEDVAREIMKPYICTRISDVSIERKITKGIVDALSALRASLEKEREELVNRAYKWMKLEENSSDKIESLESEKQALEAEKKGLEEREHIAGCYEVYGDCTCKDLHERVVEEMKQESLRHLKYLSDANIEITRLKAENEAQTYKGNSIGYIYDKMIAYQTQVFPLSNALKELGFNYPESGKDNMARERALIEWAHNKKESFDTLTCALAEAREALEYVDCQKFYTSCKEEKDKGKVFTSCLRCEALSNPTSLRASEEMKALRERMKLMWEVVTYANTVRNDILIPETDDQVEMSCQCKEWVDGLLERLKALEAYERGKV